MDLIFFHGYMTSLHLSGQSVHVTAALGISSSFSTPFAWCSGDIGYILKEMPKLSQPERSPGIPPGIAPQKRPVVKADGLLTPSKFNSVNESKIQHDAMQ